MRLFILCLGLSSFLAVGLGAPSNPEVEAGARISALRAEIRHHDELYYQAAQPEISDYEYDQLRLALSDLEQRFPAASSSLSSAPAAVGDDHAPGSPVARWEHRVPMLSLDNTYNEAGLRDFYARLSRILKKDTIPCTVEPKIDGLAVSLIYERGRLVRAATRGNGQVGDDVTVAVKAIARVPRELRGTTEAPVPDWIEIRGEAFIAPKDFEQLNKTREEAGQTPYASPRNLAVGTLKQNAPAEVVRRRLAVVCYGVGRCEPEEAAGSTQAGLLARLRAWDLPVITQETTTQTLDELLAAVRRFGETRFAGSLPWPTDGAVVKLDAVADRAQFGATAHAPRWAIAYKYTPARAETTLRAITIQVGRTGILSPVAELVPVTVGGATLSRAALHNAAEISRRDLRVGDIVVVERAGEVIPAIVGVAVAKRPPEATPYVFPSACPACGTAVVQLPGEVAWRCPSATCPAQRIRRLVYFASKACLDIPGLGEATVEDLVKRGRLQSPADLYRLRPEDIAVTGVAGKSAQALVTAISASKHPVLARFILALGIPQVGPVAARDLAKRFQSIEALMAATDVQLRSIDGLGEATTAALLAYLQQPANRALLADLHGLGVVPVAPTIAEDGSPAEGRALAGQVFVLTGTLPTLTRAEAVALIEAAGGEVKASVTRTTTRVVAGDNAGTKLAQAEELGVPVIDEAALRALLAVPATDD